MRQGAKTRLLLPLIPGMALCAASAPAYEIDYSTERAAELRACDAHYFRGRRAEARTCFSGLLGADGDPRIQAEAAWALGDADASSIETANELFREAIEKFPEDAAVRTRWGLLYAYTRKAPLAKTLYDEALAIDSGYAPALVGLAQLAAAQFEGVARGFVDEALSHDPESIGAHLLFARMELEVGNLDSAEVSIDRALELIEARNLPPVEAYALKASLDLLRGTLESPWIARALEYSPGYGDAYAIPAYFFVITRRYREAIDFYERAVEIDPANWSARTELGVNLLRENRIEEAYQHLEVSHGLFGFDAQTTNTLNLIDSFENFTLERYDATTTPAGGGAGVILRLHEDETEVLTPYLVELINRSIATFSERYAFAPQEPVIAELYPVAADFSVRTAGLPGIGLLGVTFGYLVAMNSPRPGLDGEFHWGTTLWHEMAHIFTLEATDHLVPRWFSEGVSVYEEWSTGPLRGRHIPSHVLQAMAEDKFLPVGDLDEGFIRPSYENQVIVSYMQAGLICEYIAVKHGQQALRTMLERFRAGDGTVAALEAAVGIPADEFDRQFAAHIEAEFAATLANLEAWMAAQTEMLERANESSWAEVREPAERAIALLPFYVDEGSAYLYLARAQREAGEIPAARATLTTYHEQGGYAPEALLQLARWHLADGDRDAATRVFKDLLQVAPLEEAVHAELGDLLLETEPAGALREFKALAAMSPHDEAGLKLRMARAHLALGDRDEAREQLLYALEIAPNFREAQQLLLEIVR
jgi:tetratricopeptide (TPR) repeat protein